MSALTYVLFFRLVADLGPTKAISSEFAVTLVAVIAGAVLLDERLSVVQFVGGAVIIAGLRADPRPDWAACLNARFGARWTLPFPACSRTLALIWSVESVSRESLHACA